MRQLKLLALIGSTKDHSSNQKLVRFLKTQTSLLHRQDLQQDLQQDMQQNPDRKSPILWELFPISGLPYFDPDLDKPEAAVTLAVQPVFQEDDQAVPTIPVSRVPTVVRQLREKVAAADGILICTPEYVFSLPGILKNALEWLVATTVLNQKPMALITAAASGIKAQESLELIISTLGGQFTKDTSIRIQGIAGKFNPTGELTDINTITAIQQLLDSWLTVIQLRPAQD